ncbi:MAG TPA: histidine phosphatase family protein [Candidatus Deferrimicrobiaceae bacterium]|nr:histidine phosphatase family protein [Candidatus Deferrimicrobiaceae bacterium]
MADPGLPAMRLIPDGLEATLLFVRHGESEWVAEGRFQGHGDPELSALGRRQARLTARRIARRSRAPALPVPATAPHAIVHSPLRRAAQTAALVGRELERQLNAAIPARAEAGLMEIGQGEWEGLLGTTISERWGDVLAAWRDDPVRAWAPGGESLPEVDRRVRTMLRELLTELASLAPPGTINRSQVLGYHDPSAEEPWAILVGHDGVFKIALLALLDLPLARFWTLPFALCGLTVVELRGGRPRLRLHNATDHLATLEDEAARARDAERRRSGAL